MREFWVASGHHLTLRRADGWLEVTDALLLAWLARPEILPPDEACEAERALHARLTATPRAVVEAAEVAKLDDPDARENWGFYLQLRDRLLAAGTVEGAYLAIIRDAAALPPVMVDQLAHLVMRSALDGCGDPFVLRAAELFWRPQRAALRDGALVLADREVVDAQEAKAHTAPLLAMFEGGAESLDVMTAANAWTYWSRSDAHTIGLNWGGEPRVRAGFAKAIAAFLRHLMRLDAEVTPLDAAEDVQFRWFVGLDAEATALGNAFWRGQPAEAERLIGLFRLSLAHDAIDPRQAGHPVWLLLAVTRDGVVRVKPQNLITGLPLATSSAVA